MRDADNIVVLGDSGTIVEQGTYDFLNLQQGHVQNLIVDSQTRESQSDSVLDISEDIRENLTSAVVKNSEQEEDLLRKTGDMTLYKYYLKSVGWKDGFIILSLTIGAQFCVYFPRKYMPLLFLSNFGKRLIDCRDLDQNVD